MNKERIIKMHKRVVQSSGIHEQFSERGKDSMWKQAQNGCIKEGGEDRG